MGCFLSILFSAGTLLFLLMAYALGGNFFGDLAQELSKSPESAETVVQAWRYVLAPFWKALCVLVCVHIVSRVAGWSIWHETADKDDLVRMRRLAFWMRIELLATAAFGIAASIATLIPAYGLPTWIAELPKEPLDKCLGFLKDMASTGCVYFGVWCAADGLRVRALRNAQWT